MSHRIIIINSETPAATASATEAQEPEFRIHVEYRPADGLTASQIGNEVARIQRKVAQIIDGAAD